MRKINIFEIEIANITMQQALKSIADKIAMKEKSAMYFVNADCLNKAWQNEQYQKILQSTDLIFADGSGIRYAARILQKTIIDNVNGTDMLPLLCKQAAEKRHSLFLLGAKPGIAKKMKENLQMKYPDLKILGTQHGYFDREKENEKIIKKINSLQPDILLVAFGAPAQEKWIAQNFSRLNPFVMMGVGGLFDFYSGNIPRAPLWMRKAGIEWIFRLLQEPKRMWKRYILGNPLFLLRIFYWKKMKRKK